MSTDPGYNAFGIATGFQTMDFTAGLSDLNAALLNQANYGSPTAAAPEEDIEDPLAKAYRLQAERDEERRRQNAIEVIKGLMTDYNLTSLYDKMVEFVRAGYDADAIMILIRNTPEYKQRFPAMEALSKKGKAISEAAYIEYERNAASLEKMYGLPSGMVSNNVTALLTNDISADELRDRVTMASAASVTAPQEFKDTLKNYYGIDSGGLAGYFLDPELAKPILQKQYATAILGAEAVRQNVSLGVDLATNLQDMGVTAEQAQQGFGNVRQMESFTSGRGDTVSQTDLIKGTFGQTDAASNVERVRGSRLARFEGGGSFLSARDGVSGLGSAAT